MNLPNQNCTITIQDMPFGKPPTLSITSHPAGAAASVSVPHYTPGHVTYAFAPDVTGEYDFFTADGSTPINQFRTRAAVGETSVTFDESGWHGATTVPSIIKVDCVPPGSTLRGTTCARTALAKGRADFEFKGDTGGIYRLTRSDTGGMLSVQIVTTLECQIRSSSGNSGATVTVKADGGVAVEAKIAKPTDTGATMAIQSPSVLAVVDALVNMNGNQVKDVGLPAVVSAFSAAIVTPPTLPNEDAMTPILMGDGWKKV